MRVRNRETPTFAGAGGTTPAIVEGLEIIDHQENVLATLTKSVAGVFSHDLPLANGVKVYRAKFTQTGTSDPVVTVIENTLGGTVVWTRVDVGTYLVTLAAAFTTKTQIFPGGYLPSGGQVSFARSSANALELDTVLFNATNPSFDAADSLFANSPLDILITVTP
jgi:hypothetical protein